MSQSEEIKVKESLEKRRVSNGLLILSLIIQNAPIDRKTLQTLSGLPYQSVQDALMQLQGKRFIQKSRQVDPAKRGPSRVVFEIIPLKDPADQARLDAQLAALKGHLPFRPAPQEVSSKRVRAVPAANSDLYQFVCRRCFRVYVAEDYQEPRHRVCLSCKPLEYRCRRCLTPYPAEVYQHPSHRVCPHCK